MASHNNPLATKPFDETDSSTWFVRSEVKVSPLDCTICQETFDSRVERIEHQQATHVPNDEGRFECPDCPSTTQTLSDLVVHCRDYHQPVLSRLYCNAENCDASAVRERDMMKHLRRKNGHLPRLECKNCTLEFFYEDALKLHESSCTNIVAKGRGRGRSPSKRGFATPKKSSRKPGGSITPKKRHSAERRSDKTPRKRIHLAFEDSDVDDVEADGSNGAKETANPVIEDDEDDPQESTLRLVLELDANNELVVRSNETDIQMAVRPNDTVEAMVHAIQNRMGIPPDQQRFAFAGPSGQPPAESEFAIPGPSNKQDPPSPDPVYSSDNDSVGNNELNEAHTATMMEEALESPPKMVLRSRAVNKPEKKLDESPKRMTRSRAKTTALPDFDNESIKVGIMKETYLKNRMDVFKQEMDELKSEIKENKDHLAQFDKSKVTEVRDSMTQEDFHSVRVLDREKYKTTMPASKELPPEELVIVQRDRRLFGLDNRTQKGTQTLNTQPPDLAAISSIASHTRSSPIDLTMVPPSAENPATNTDAALQSITQDLVDRSLEAVSRIITTSNIEVCTEPALPNMDVSYHVFVKLQKRLSNKGGTPKGGKTRKSPRKRTWP